MVSSNMDEVVSDRLGGIPFEHDYQQAFVECLVEILHGKTPLETISITGNLIRFLIDHVSSELSAVRRTAAMTAKQELHMTTLEIAEASGQSTATILRLLTEHRNIGKTRPKKVPA